MIKIILFKNENDKRIIMNGEFHKNRKKLF